ncbi:hypothetical protein ACLD72_000540 [Paenibacillus sp. TH7-28]
MVKLMFAFAFDSLRKFIPFYIQTEKEVQEQSKLPALLFLTIWRLGYLLKMRVQKAGFPGPRRLDEARD